MTDKFPPISKTFQTNVISLEIEVEEWVPFFEGGNLDDFPKMIIFLHCTAKHGKCVIIAKFKCISIFQEITPLAKIKALSENRVIFKPEKNCDDRALLFRSLIFSVNVKSVRKIAAFGQFSIVKSVLFLARYCVSCEIQWFFIRILLMTLKDVWQMLPLEPPFSQVLHRVFSSLSP